MRAHAGAMHSARPFLAPHYEDSTAVEQDEELAVELESHLREEQAELDYTAALHTGDTDTECCTSPRSRSPVGSVPASPPATVCSSSSESIGLRSPQPLTNEQRALQRAPGLHHAQSVLATALQEVALGTRTVDEFVRQAHVIACFIEPGPCAASYGSRTGIVGTAPFATNYGTGTGVFCTSPFGPSIFATTAASGAYGSVRGEGGDAAPPHSR